MVATLVRLRAALLRRTLAHETWRLVLLVLGLLWALSTLPSVVGGMIWLSRQPADVGHDVLVMAGAVLVLGWGLVPVLVPGLDDSLEVRRFVTFAVPARRLAPGLLAASLLGLPTAYTALVCLAPALAWAGIGGAPAALAAVVAAPLALLTCVLASRLTTSVATRFLGSRRSREIGAVLGLLVLLLAVPVVVAIGSLGLERALEEVPRVASVLGWTPLGLPFAAPAAMAQGRWVEALVRLGLSAGCVAAGLAAWTALLRLAMVRPPSRGGQVRRRLDAVLPAREPRRFAGRGALAARAVARRSLRSWGGDPRYVSALLGAVVAPVVVVLLVATVVDAPAAVALSMGPVMAGSIGWGRHNDVAFDGSAFWMHVAARVPGWSDRLGRALAVLVWAVPLTVVVSVGGALVAGRPGLAPAAVGAGLGVLAAGLAVSAVFSTLLPYPVPDPGASPFAAQLGSVGASLVAQVVTSAATSVLALPVLVLFGLTLWRDADLGPAVLAVGVLGGALVLAGGVVLGGRIYDGRAARVLPRLA